MSEKPHLEFSNKVLPQQSEIFRKFQACVLGWATLDHLRDFPWRHTREPYRLLISELMLRRTQARQVAPVYTEFCRRWPTLPDFLTADTGEILAVLRPLGLCWRIQNMLEVREALRRLGELPSQYLELRSLPGVGDYVASAVLCFSHLESRPLIDTNTVRVIGRYFGIHVNPGTRRLKSFRELSLELVPLKKRLASVYHYSLLDIAAAICRPHLPRCSECPLVSGCQSVHLKGA